MIGTKRKAGRDTAGQAFAAEGNGHFTESRRLRQLPPAAPALALRALCLLDSAFSAGCTIQAALQQVLEGAGVFVIPSDMDNPGYAFAVGDNVYRLSYGMDQQGNPINLEMTLGGTRQLMPIRDIRLVGDMLYLPCESITAVTGITFEKGDQQIILVTLP